MKAIDSSYAAALLLCLSIFLFFWGLGQIPFYTKGEPREAVVVWEAVHSGDWILPLRNGHEIPSKPPLFHWLGGLTALVLGRVDEFAVRFPSAFLATLTVLLVYWLGAVKWGTNAGFFAGAMLATNFEWLRAATIARVDMTLTAFLVGAFVALDRIVSAERPPPRALAAFYVCMGLASLGKGPVGILLPSLVAITYLAVRRDLGRLAMMRPVLGGAVALGLAGWWYAAAIARGGEAFVWKQLLVENLLRFFAAGSSGAGHVHPWYYTIGGFFTGFAPWSIFVVPLVIHLWHRRHRLEALGYLYPVVWFAVVFAFYSAAESKRTVYLLPAYPAAALLLGAWWKELVESQRSVSPIVDRALQIAGGVMATIVVVVLVFLLATRLGFAPLELVRPILHPKDQANLPIVQEILDFRFAILLSWGAILVPVVALFVTSARARRWGLVFAALVAFTASTTAVVNAVFHPGIARRRTLKPFITAVRGVVGEGDALGFYRTFDYGAVFYARRHIRPLHDGFDPPPDGGRSYVLLWESEWDKLPPEDRARLDFLEKSEGTGPKGQSRLVLAIVKPLKTDNPVP